MRRFVVLVPAVILLLGAGCRQRLTDFTFLSTKNVDLSRMGSLSRAGRATGVDTAHVLFFIPTGTPNYKEAADRAIESVPGGVALVDGVLETRWFLIPGLYAQSSARVEGTVLIDPDAVRQTPDPEPRRMRD